MFASPRQRFRPATYARCSIFFNDEALFLSAGARLINRTRLYPNKEKCLTVLILSRTSCPSCSRLVSGHATREVDARSPYTYTYIYTPYSELKPPEGSRRHGKVMAGRALSYSDALHVTGRATLDINVSIITIRRTAATLSVREYNPRV